ncbi:MAG: 30S ribosomal protein S8 [Candidatus Falkowbacteria bacterium]|nr:30S ribosomal protein S8 [Candidatus Falkowbacteria bacterium]
MNDPIADMLSRIRNAAAVGRPELVLPMSKLKFNIAKLLQETGWIGAVEVIKHETTKVKGSMFDELRIVLKYKPDGTPAFASIKRVSKSSRRIYVGKAELPKVLNGFGMAIVSTSQGIMTNKEARRRNLGGEVICEVY